MKRFLKIVAVLVLLVAIGIGLLAYRGSRLDREASEYAEQSIDAIVTDWSQEALLSRASPDLRKTSNAEDMDKLFTMFRRLGRLLHADEPRGQALMSLTNRSGSQTTATYTSQAEFENAPATISISLIKRGDQWLIQGFRVDSKFFLQ
jgi:hypothetical protein